MSSIPKKNRGCNVSLTSHGIWDLVMHEHLKTMTHTDRYTLEIFSAWPDQITFDLQLVESTRKSGHGPGKYVTIINRDPDKSTCNCPGFEHIGKPCKHIASLTALIEVGRLPGFDECFEDDLDTMESLEAARFDGYDWE